MKKGILLFFVVYLIQLFSSNSEDELRKMYYSSIENPENANKFLNYFDTVDVKNNALLLGYNAVANFSQCKHKSNPFTKLEYFNIGKLQLEEAIAIDESNLELRFLRYSIQMNLPSFLGYSSEKESDRNYLVQHVEFEKDTDLKDRIIEFLKIKK